MKYGRNKGRGERKGNKRRKVKGEERERGRLIKGKLNDGVCPAQSHFYAPLFPPSTLTRVNVESSAWIFEILIRPPPNPLQFLLR